VLPTLSFDKMLAQAAEADIKLFCYEGDGTRSMKEVLAEEKADFDARGGDALPRISIVIGSEGGFSLAEVERAKEAGFVPVGLGKRILRTESAAAFVLACLSSEFELR
jgi:16S rRNA (uracil1498-N3)-methyltransferase